MRLKVETENGESANLALNRELNNGEHKPKNVGDDAGQMRKRLKALLILTLMFALTFAPVAAQGIRSIVPYLDWDLYHMIWPLYWVPILNRIDTALILAFFIMGGVVGAAHHQMHHIRRVQASGRTWYRDGETMLRLLAILAVLLIDCGLVYMGLSNQVWGQVGFKRGPFLVTVAYGMVIVSLTYAGSNATRALAQAKAAALILLLSLTLVAGCEPPKEPSLQQRKSEYVLAAVVDITRSFLDLVPPRRVWEWVPRVADQFHDDRAGSDDDLMILSKISGDQTTEVWRGTPRSLREEFASPADLESFVMGYQDNNGSRVIGAICHTLKQVMDDPNVAAGKPSMVIIVSDMFDESADGNGKEAELDRLLAEYGRKGGEIGVYFCREDCEDQWRRRLEKAGVKHLLFKSTDHNPPVPRFSQ